MRSQTQAVEINFLQRTDGLFPLQQSEEFSHSGGVQSIAATPPHCK